MRGPQALKDSHESETCSSSPEISSTAFRAQPPNLRSASLIDMGFAIIGPLARHSRLRSGFCTLACSKLPSDPTSRRRPCVSLSLHLYQVVKRTFTSKQSTLLGVHRHRGSGRPLAPATRPDMRVRIRRFGGLN